jgi:hypothetical protein
MGRGLTQEENRVARRELLRLNAKAWGVATGLLAGLSLFIATVFLVVKGGEHVGQHLRLLAVYLPGYRVTIPGAFLGFIYMFVIGYALGRMIGWIYNYLTMRRA